MADGRDGRGVPRLHGMDGGPMRGTRAKDIRRTLRARATYPEVITPGRVVRRHWSQGWRRTSHVAPLPVGKLWRQDRAA
jgi:hypothetical protein